MIRFSEGVTEGQFETRDLFENKVPSFDTNISTDDAVAFWNKEFMSLSDVSILDILNYDEESFSFDIDISDNKELLNNFKESNWNDLSDEERKEAVSELTKKIAEKLELKEIPTIEFYNADPSDCGYYDADQNVLGINSCELDDPTELVNTIAHELRHAYQHEHANNPESHTDDLYRINFAYYIRPMFTDDGECLLFYDYQNQFVEAEARAFANYVIEGMEES